MVSYGKELDVLIRARYPILYVVTWEEERVEKELMKIGQARNKKVYVWTITSGVVPYGTAIENKKHRDEGTRDPLEALDRVLEDVAPAIYLFKDFHPFMKEPSVCRKLRDVAAVLKNSYKSLVLTAPTLCIPPELDKDISLVDIPLPTAEELNQLLERILQEVKDQPNIKVLIGQGERERLIHAALGLTLKEAENVFAKIIVNDGCITGNDVKTIVGEKQQIIKKSGLLEYYAAEEQLEDIGGLDLLKEWLRKRQVAFSEQAKAYGLPPPKGVLLVGVQGCGKSLCAKAVSNCWNLPLLRMDVGKLFGGLVGSSEGNMRQAIKIAESVAPAILWVDEIEKAFAGLQSSGTSDGGTTSRVIGTFLTWLQEKSSSVFVVATANSVSTLPPELLRKGRLDEIFFVDLPGAAEREMIFKIHMRKRGKVDGAFSYPALVRASEGFSGAEIEQAIVSAMFDVFERQAPLTDQVLLTSLEETVPLSKTMKEDLERLRTWAESRARHAGRVEAVAAADPDRRKLEL